MKITTLTSGVAALAVGATLALGGPALARHGGDDGPGDDHGRRHGGHGADDRGDHRRDDHGRRRGGRDDDSDRSRGRGRHHGRHDDDHRGRGRGRGGHGHHGQAGGAKEDRRVEASGPCSSGAWWELKAKDEDGGIEWELEVESHVAGQTWQVLVTQNGETVLTGPATTTGYSPSFSIEDTVMDLAGMDTFVATAQHGDQTCTGTVVY